jgi:hypothetical protein
MIAVSCGPWRESARHSPARHNRRNAAFSFGHRRRDHRAYRKSDAELRRIASDKRSPKQVS